MVSLSLSLVCIDLMVLLSECVFCVVWELLRRGLLMRSAVRFLYTSLSVGGSFDITVLASSARFCIQFLFLVCILNFGPFSSIISWSVNFMSVVDDSGVEVSFLSGGCCL